MKNFLPTPSIEQLRHTKKIFDYKDIFMILSFRIFINSKLVNYNKNYQTYKIYLKLMSKIKEKKAKKKEIENDQFSKLLLISIAMLISSSNLHFTAFRS